MEQSYVDLDDYIVQRRISEFPNGVKEVLSKIYDDFGAGITKGKAPVLKENNFSGIINLIPSNGKGICCPVLVGLCYDNDHFENRMLECLDHVSRICPGINHEIFFFTTQWNSSIANKYRGYMESLRRDGVLIHLIYVTDLGIALMPV